MFSIHTYNNTYRNALTLISGCTPSSLYPFWRFMHVKHHRICRTLPILMASFLAHAVAGRGRARGSSRAVSPVTPLAGRGRARGSSRAVSPLLPHRFADVRRKALSKNPAHHFSTVKAFVQALEQSSKVTNTMRSQLLAIKDQYEVHSIAEEVSAYRNTQKIYPKKKQPPRLFKKLLLDLLLLIIGHGILWFLMSQLYSWFLPASSLLILLTLRLSRLNSALVRSIISAILLMSLPIGRVLHSNLSINIYYVFSLLLTFYMVISMKANPSARQRKRSTG